jgi:hypothetical protein
MAICETCHGLGVIEVSLSRFEQCPTCFGTGGDDTELLSFDALRRHIHRVHEAITTE